MYRGATHAVADLRQFVHQPARSTTSWARAWAVKHAGSATTAALAVAGAQLA